MRRKTIMLPHRNLKARPLGTLPRPADFTPFNPTDKRSTATVSRDSESFTVSKGAPQVILDLVQPADEERRTVNDKVDDLGGQGYRALGVARQRDGQWRYLGLLTLLDPPRPGTAEVVEAAKEHGIDVRMVTGDHAAIAQSARPQAAVLSRASSSR